MTEIKARQGYYLTQAGEVSEGRIYVTAVKGMKVEESQWREATLQEKEEWQEKQDANNNDAEEPWQTGKD